jgi:hypothetical protein
MNSFLKPPLNYKFSLSIPLYCAILWIAFSQGEELKAEPKRKTNLLNASRKILFFLCWPLNLWTHFNLLIAIHSWVFLCFLFPFYSHALKKEGERNKLYRFSTEIESSLLFLANFHLIFLCRGLIEFWKILSEKFVKGMKGKLEGNWGNISRKHEKRSFPKVYHRFCHSKFHQKLQNLYQI